MKLLEMLYWFERLEMLESTSMKEAAVEAVEAMAVAPTGRGWLWVPSYVVISIDMSSRHLWTYKSGKRTKQRHLLTFDENDTKEETKGNSQ